MQLKKKIKILYKIIFQKGFFYYYIQKFIVNINLRDFLSKIEKIIFQFLYKKNFKENILEENTLSRLLKTEGVTNVFELQSLNENKHKIIEYFNNNKIFYDKDPNKLFTLKDRDEKIKIGYYKPETTANCPYIFDIVNDNHILNTLNSYFKSPYKLDYMAAWWSFTNKGLASEKTQYFHRDLDSLNFIKFFIYLTDVDLNSGPHQYIKYSQLKYYGHKVNRKTIDEKNIKDLESENLFTFTGKSGSVIGENTFGFHRAMTPVSNDRLMLVLCYSLAKTYYGPSKPFLNLNNLKLKNKNINKYINQTYIL